MTDGVNRPAAGVVSEGEPPPFRLEGRASPDALVPDNVLGHRLVEKQATVYLGYLVAVAVGIVAVSKALDLLLAG